MLTRIVFALFVFVALFTTVALSSYAYRPFGTEDTGVAGKGVFQTELSFDHLKWNDGSLEQVFLFVPIFGISDNLELSVELPFIIHHSDDGSSSRAIGDINLAAKYLLAQEGLRIPTLTLKGTVKLDNGNYDNGFGSGDKDYSLFAVVAKTFGNIIINTNLGYTFIGKLKNPDFRDIFLYGLAFDYGLTDKFHLLAELNGNKHPDNAETDDPRDWLVGIIYKFSDKLIFDIASKWGLSKSSPDWNMTSGVSLTF
ncbi:hypothetical protein A2310_06855 [candidate division WOR-1 bacterium RIFOXYB2_FULL_37_13]|uniref:Transporter n=1 Tax=candidate division WOR-1 bacterium RIFOXYB2_FULL_37_13 TaxID=1802579 RepID=A0A1F4SMK0_UNCSA|nr:MAG: hypothetical protein A2310_06855 [candidate division WOR-1 bacterium RIFOXYB2_FULL_37_13]